MMHPNFFHWHAHAELKPDLTILEPRWNAAAKFAEKLSAADICSLLRLVLFSGAEPEFAKRFSEGLVKLEPTFPPEKNAELLRVMAAAAIHSQMEKPSSVADTIALGLKAAAFPNGRVEPVCKDVMTRAAEFLAVESERIRPAISAGTLAKAEKQAEASFATLKKAVDANTPPEVGKATEALGRSVLTAMKESHSQLAEVVHRLTEESQFVWWLVGRRSAALNSHRALLTAENYALPAAAEAAERVTLLPPAPSVESLLDEVLAQCGEGGRDSASIADLIAAANAEWVQRGASTIAVPELTPLSALLAGRRASGKPDASLFKRLHISSKMKAAPMEVARQYFHELMFLRALDEVN